MRVVPSAIPEVLIIEPDVHRDARGFFFEAYHTERYRAAGVAERFVQDNHARSVRGTLRGLHGQRRHSQGKLVRATLGEVFDVAVDIREGSPRRGQWVGVRLSAENHRQVYIPPGFLHGYCVLTDAAEIEYKCTAHYDPADEIGVAWNDPTIGVSWPITDPLLSARDAALPGFDALR